MNAKNTRRAFFSSVVALVICCTMLMGTTFAWFTDTATVAVNTIQSGTLDIAIEKLVNGEWVNAEGTTLGFATADNRTDILWEPGCTYNLEDVRIANNGNLALKYKVVISGVQGTESANLATVIDVLVGGVKVGTLADVMLDPNGVAYGTMIPTETKNVGTISLHMQETAGNEFQNQSISDIAITVVATQHTHEYDSNNNTYDADASLLVDDYPFAGVYSIADLTVPTSASETIPLDAGYSFKATDTAEEAEASKYAKYHVDFVVSADTDIPAGALTLAGQYESWSQYWLAFTNEKAVPAGDKIRLLDSAGVTMNYEELCELVKVFSCGLKSDVLDGTTVKVELTLFEVEEASEENNNSWNVETGESITIGTYTYTFGAADEETPRATVTELKGEALEVNVASNWSNMNTTTPIALDAGYTFATTETYDEAKDSKFAEWHADFVVTSDKALAANTLTLAGQYNAWSANWLAITNPADVAANGSIRLLGSANLYMSYAELCRDVQNFNCGLAEVTDGALTGTTITVELRLFETVGGNETGKYEVVGTYKYTF